MDRVRLVRRTRKSLIGVLAFLLAGCWLLTGHADDAQGPQKESQEGNVEISLKLLPSAPEKETVSDSPGPATSPATSSSPSDEEKGSSKKSAINVQKDQVGATKANANATDQPLGNSKPEKRKISDNIHGLEASATRRPANLVRVLELSIEPETDPKDGKRTLRLKNSDSLIGGQKLTAGSEQNLEECPGGQQEGSNEVAGQLPSLPGDIPLEQDEQPLEVPEALSTAPERRLTQVSRGNSGKLQSRLEAEDIKTQIESVLEYFSDHPENVTRRGPWAIMHVILPYGVEAEILAGNRRVNAIGWLCHNGVSARQRMFQPTQTGFRPNLGPGVQGHDGQFLAILAQSRVQSDYPLQVGKRKYSIKDLIRYEMLTCREKSELTFKLIAFSHYLQPDQVWKDNRGKSWSIEKLVAEELAQPITGAACGGTHRLMGLTCAVVRRQEAGLPLEGHYLRAKIFLDEFVEYTLSLQNPDGSFSTEWFESRADEPNIDRKIQTSGHILEWLVYTLPDEHLHKAEITKAVRFLVESIGDSPERNWPIGPRGHSLRALALYHQRMFPSPTSEHSGGGRVAEEMGSTPQLR